MVAAVAAGDPRGIADAYDRYAVPLYSYCRSLLPEPADAADAVQDTFLIATAKLSGLRHPDKLRAWLYAVARNECYRRLRSGKLTSALEEAADLTADAVDVSSAVEQAELRQLVRDALGGLNPGERDVVELSLVHGPGRRRTGRRAPGIPQPRARAAVPGPQPAGTISRRAAGRAHRPGRLRGSRRPAGRAGTAS